MYSSPTVLSSGKFSMSVGIKLLNNPNFLHLTKWLINRLFESFIFSFLTRALPATIISGLIMLGVWLFLDTLQLPTSVLRKGYYDVFSPINQTVFKVISLLAFQSLVFLSHVQAFSGDTVSTLTSIISHLIFLVVSNDNNKTVAKIIQHYFNKNTIKNMKSERTWHDTRWAALLPVRLIDELAIKRCVDQRAKKTNTEHEMIQGELLYCQFT